MKNVPKPPGGSVVAAAIAVFGALGTILDVKHAWVSISDIFYGCQGFGCIDRLFHLDDTRFNGVMVWVGILMVSLLALIVGGRSLLRRLREQGEDEKPRVSAKPAKKAVRRRGAGNVRATGKTSDRDSAVVTSKRNEIG